MALLGLDVELMITDGKRLVSAIPLFSGTKEEPQKLKLGMVSHDNVNVEFGADPASSEKEWTRNIKQVLAQVHKMLPPKHSLLVQASAIFPDDQLDNPIAQQFGCSVDFDAYDVAQNDPPNTKKNPKLRSAGGHIHIGLDSIIDDVEKICGMTKAMDLFVGVPSILLDKDPTSERRRQLYGRAGCHRPKPYGVEYRTLGNFWVESERMAKLIYNLSIEAVDAFENGHTKGIDEAKIRRVINSGDKKVAAEIVNGLVKNLISKKLFNELIEMIKEPASTNLYKGWGL